MMLKCLYIYTYCYNTNISLTKARWFIIINWQQIYYNLFGLFEKTLSVLTIFKMIRSVNPNFLCSWDDIGYTYIQTRFFFTTFLDFDYAILIISGFVSTFLPLLDDETDFANLCEIWGLSQNTVDKTHINLLIKPVCCNFIGLLSFL